MGHTKQPDKADFTPGDWQAWQLAPDSDPQERSIVVAGPNGETEICGIVNNPADVPLIANAKKLYLYLENILSVWDQDDSYPLVREQVRELLRQSRGQQ